ncbi:MAG: hypothetical protein AAGB12_06660, partial [Pseudomonadota bacterium]
VLTTWQKDAYLIICFSMHPENPYEFIELACLDNEGNSLQYYFLPKDFKKISSKWLMHQGLSRKNFRLAVRWSFMQMELLSLFHQECYQYRLTDDSELLSMALEYQCKKSLFDTKLPKFTDVLDVFSQIHPLIFPKTTKDGGNDKFAKIYQLLTRTTPLQNTFRAIERCQIIQQFINRHS